MLKFQDVYKRQLSKLFGPASRAFATTKVAGDQQVVKTATKLAEVNGADTLIGPGAKDGEVPVSYTHLDVYKRQGGL